MVTSDELAREFSRQLVGEIGLELATKAAEINRNSNDLSTCASHDFCDANMVLMDACEVKGVDIWSLWNDELTREAWELAYNNGFYLTAKEEVKMNYNNVSLLTIVECYAEEAGKISSEEELSRGFDDDIMPGLLEEYGVKGHKYSDYGRISMTFSSWMDELCETGRIHQEQVANYIYVGEWADRRE